MSDIARRRILTVGAAGAIAGVVTGKVQASPDQTNREKVESFFIALETGRFEILKEIFAEDAQQINPYSWGQFPKSLMAEKAFINNIVLCHKPLARCHFLARFMLPKTPMLYSFNSKAI